MYRQIIVSLILIVVFLAIGGGVAARLISTAPQAPTSDTAAPAMLVRGLVLKPQTVVEPIVGYGTARADRRAWIAAQVAGELVELSPKLHVGELVEEGEFLLRLDDREYQHYLDRARGMLAADEAQLERLVVEERNVDHLIAIASTQLEIAEREYERVIGLFEQGQAPRREVDIARQANEQARRTLQGLENQKALFPQQRAALHAARDQHRAEVGLAELNMERTRVLAPFRGQLEAVEVEIGERVNVGARLCALLDPDLIEIPIELPASLRDRIASGTQCQLRLESNPGVAWEGAVARIAPNASEATRTFSLYVEVDNTRQKQVLMPGLFIRAMIEGPTWSDVIVVPRGLVQRGHVYVYQDGLVRQRTVEIERHLFDQTIVRGVQSGETIIVSNLDALYDQAPVRLGQEDAENATGTAEDNSGAGS